MNPMCNSAASARFFLVGRFRKKKFAESEGKLCRKK
jgi:hypothetical protein